MDECLNAVQLLKTPNSRDTAQFANRKTILAAWLPPHLEGNAPELSSVLVPTASAVTSQRLMEQLPLTVF